MDKVFVDTYLKIIKESTEDICDILNFKGDNEDGEFNVHLVRSGEYGSTYRATLSGHIDRIRCEGHILIAWKIKDHNNVAEGSVGLKIDGKTNDYVKIEADPDDNNLRRFLEDLYEKFKVNF